VPSEFNARRPENELSKLLNWDFPVDTEASGAVTDAISATLAQLLVPEQKYSAFRLEPPRNNSRMVGQPEAIQKRASRYAEFTVPIRPIPSKPVSGQSIGVDSSGGRKRVLADKRLKCFHSPGRFEFLELIS
jgi:hypothetical protein